MLIWCIFVPVKVAVYIANELFPEAIEWFTGEAAEVTVSDEEEDSDEDSIDDDDDAEEEEELELEVLRTRLGKEESDPELTGSTGRRRRSVMRGVAAAVAVVGVGLADAWAPSASSKSATDEPLSDLPLRDLGVGVDRDDELAEKGGPGAETVTEVGEDAVGVVCLLASEPGSDSAGLLLGLRSMSDCASSLSF